MSEENAAIPLRMTKLIVAFYQHTLTPAEHTELDAWICDSTENQRAFKQCGEMVCRPFQRYEDDPEESDEEETSQYFSHIADLIIKHLKKHISTQEKEELFGWVEASDQNKALFDALPKTDDMELIFKWIIGGLWQDKDRPEWN